MFKDYNSKLEALAKAIAILGIIVTIVLSVGEYRANGRIAFLITFVVGDIISLIVPFLLYGFSKIVESLCILANNKEKEDNTNKEEDKNNQDNKQA